MLVSDLLVQGVNLMLLGMGSVFVFLTVLVLALGVVARVARLLDKGEPSVSAGVVAGESVSSTDDEIIAVITAAIKRYRSK